jgi:hypothetical protein
MRRLLLGLTVLVVGRAIAVARQAHATPVAK